MSCETVEPELVAYHFGTLEPGMRQVVEDHLLGCVSCLREFMTLKRNMELGEAEPPPSQAARERLRLSVARELRGSAPSRTWRWWERPLALGGAVAVLASAMFMTYTASVREAVAPRALSQMARDRGGSVPPP